MRTRAEEPALSFSERLRELAKHHHDSHEELVTLEQQVYAKRRVVKTLGAALVDMRERACRRCMGRGTIEHHKYDGEGEWRSTTMVLCGCNSGEQ